MRAFSAASCSTLVLALLLPACGSSDSGNDAAGSGASAGAIGGSPGAGGSGTGGTSNGGGSSGKGGTGGSGTGGKSATGGTGGNGTGGKSGGGAGGATGGAAGKGGNAGTAGPGGQPSGGMSSGGTSAGGGSGGVNPSPTVSSWVGTNISADLPRIDVAYQLNGFDTPAASLDANGYPMPGASGKSGTDLGFVLPSGTYKLSYKGDGTLNVSGIGKLKGAFQSAAGEHRAEIDITGSPGNFGQFLNLEIQNAPGQSVTDIHLYYPGFDYDATDVFLPPFLNLLKPFRAMRFMDWEATNNSKLVEWKDRPIASRYGQSPNGQPYEHIAALVNATGKDAWITVPENVSDDFVQQMAAFYAKNLDFTAIQAARDAQGYTTPFQLLLENSNETWNMGFSSYGTFLALAKADAARYDGTYAGSYGPSWMSGNKDLMTVGQYEADRLVKIATVFRAELAKVGHDAAVAPVLSGWALGAVYSDVGMQFIQKNYGDPKKYVSYVALAPYFGADDAKSGSLDQLFPALADDIASKDAAYADFKKLGDQYGIGIAAYEGGQGLTGTVNQPIKHLAQHDQRMYDTYNTYFALWTKHFGKSLFMHFALAGDPGIPEFIYQYGYWSSIIGVLEDPSSCMPALPTLTGSESIDSVVHHCPKYRALAEQVP